MGLAKNRVRELYGKLRQGAAVHSRAVRLFGETPRKPVKELFREAVSGTQLTPNQRAYLLNTFKHLKENHRLVEKTRKEVSAEELLAMCFRGLGLKPESVENPLNDLKIKELLERSKGKSGLILVSGEQLRNKPKRSTDAFGLTLTIDNPTYERLKSRAQEIGLMTEGYVGAFCSPLVFMDPITKEVNKVLLTIMPEKMVVPEARSEVEEHERIHRENVALGIGRKSIGAPKNRTEAREWVSNQLKQEFIASANDGHTAPVREIMRQLFAQQEDIIRESLSEQEIRDFLEIPRLIDESFIKIPRNELVSIIRTTPLTKLRKRLQGVLTYT
ncbi:MAG: hypothetical protein V1494_07035 [Candidatus Diapherotrites archaeon]